MIRRAVLIVLLAARAAYADYGSWQGYQALGIPDEQTSVLSGVTIEGLRQGGMIEDVILEESIAKCGADVSCHCGVARKRGVRYAMFGSLGKLGDLWTIELTLVDTHACTVEGSAYLSESLADTRVPARIIELAKRMATPQATVATTAVGRETKISATPALVTTFTRSQLRALRIRTLDELLTFVPGFDVVDASWGGLVLNQGLPNTLLVMSDGIPLVNGLNNFRWLDRDYRSSLVHVSRVELVRGPGAVLWGRNAFMGVMNLISEPAQRREASVEAGVTVGSLDTEEIWGRVSQNRGRYSFTGSVDIGRRVGPSVDVPDSPQALLGVSPPAFGNGGTTDPKPDLWFDTHLRLSFGNRIDAIFQNQTSDIHYELSPRGPLLDSNYPGEWEKTHRLYALIGTHPLYEDDAYLVTVKGTASRYEYYSWENFAVQPLWPDGPAPADPTDPTMRDYRLGLRSLQGNRKPRVANQGDARLRIDFDGLMENHFTAGIGVLDLRTPDSLATLAGVTEEPMKPTVSFGEKESISLSTFALEEWVPTEGFGLSAGARVQTDGVQDKADVRHWATQIHAQGGAVFERDPFGIKLVFSQGFRPPDAVSLYSQVGTQGYELLKPERSNELATEAHVDVSPEVTLRAGGNLTRISHLIVLVPVAQPSPFFYTPRNKGRIDVASGFAQVEIKASEVLDAFATYHFTALDETAPVTPTTGTNPDGRGIPLAKHIASAAAVWRPARDLSLFARGTYASPRHLHVLTANDPTTYRVTKPTIRTMIGISLANALGPFDLDLAIDNPLFLAHDAPYTVDGTVAGLIERRRYTEAFATLRYEK